MADPGIDDCAECRVPRPADQPRPPEGCGWFCCWEHAKAYFNREGDRRRADLIVVFERDKGLLA